MKTKKKGVKKIPLKRMLAWQKEYMKDMRPKDQEKFFPHFFLKDQYYSIKEIAKLLKVAYLTVYRWIRAEKLTAYKAGKQYRISKQTLGKFLNKKNNI